MLNSKANLQPKHVEKSSKGSYSSENLEKFIFPKNFPFILQFSMVLKAKLDRKTIFTTHKTTLKTFEEPFEG